MYVTGAAVVCMPCKVVFPKHTSYGGSAIEHPSIPSWRQDSDETPVKEDTEEAWAHFLKPYLPESSPDPHRTMSPPRAWHTPESPPCSREVALRGLGLSHPAAIRAAN